MSREGVQVGKERGENECEKSRSASREKVRVEKKCGERRSASREEVRVENECE